MTRGSDRALAALCGLACALILGMLALTGAEVLYALPRALSATREQLSPAIFGTTALTLLTTLIGLPAGVATAVYLTEYAPRGSRLAGLVRTCVTSLAGVPPVIFGLFGLELFVRALGSVMGQGHGLVWASLTMALLTLPVVVVTTEEVLRGVPRELREASLALGATKLQTIVRTVLPEAYGGILTGAVLAMSRAAAEVAPLMVLGLAEDAPEVAKPEQLANLGYDVARLAMSSSDVRHAEPRLHGALVILFCSTLLLNLIAVLLRRWTRRHLRLAS